MARYTMTLYDLMKSGFDIGLKDYPIFDESYRKVLNEKLISHYLFHEIGQETPLMFKHYLNTAMREIMPLMIKRYESTLKEYDIFGNIDITETFTTKRVEENLQDVNGSSTGEGSSSATTHDETTGSSTSDGTNDVEVTGFNAKSDIGNQSVSLKDITNNVYLNESNYTENTDSATTHSEDTSRATSDGTSSSTNKSSNISTTKAKEDKTMLEDYTRTTKGSSAGLSFSKALEQYRDILIDVDMEIIEHEKIRSCFMMVF